MEGIPFLEINTPLGKQSSLENSLSDTF